MRKAIAVVGIVGLGMAFGSTAAVAAPATRPPGLLICHATGPGTYEPFLVSAHGLTLDLNGHRGHSGDIIPIPGDPIGQNMTPENVALLNNGCVGPAPVPAGPAAMPGDATLKSPPAGGAMNPGYNVDGAVQEPSGEASPLWLGVLAAFAALGVWKVTVRVGKMVR